MSDDLFQWPDFPSLMDIQRSVDAHRAAPTPCLLPTAFGTYDRRRLDFLEEHGCEPGARFASEKLPPQFWSRLGREYWCTGCGMIKRTEEGRK